MGIFNAIQAVNSFLLPLVGAALLFRFFTGAGPFQIGLLGGLFLAYGLYRLRSVCGRLRRGGGA